MFFIYMFPRTDNFEYLLMTISESLEYSDNKMFLKLMFKKMETIEK